MINSAFLVKINNKIAITYKNYYILKMKRNLNESAINEHLVTKICVSDIRKDDDSMDCNELRDIFVSAGARVEGSHGLSLINGEPETIMSVIGLPEDQVVDILNDFLVNSEYCGIATDYIINYDLDDRTEDFNDVKDFPAYEDVELDPEQDALNDDVLNESDDILDEAKDELRTLLSTLDDDEVVRFEEDGITLDEIWPYDDGDDNIVVFNIDSNGDMEVAQSDELLSAYELTDADDIFTLCDVIKDLINVEKDYPDYDDVDDEEEYTPRVEKMGHHKKLDEKKKGNCCPGTKTVNEKESIDLVLKDIDEQILNEAKDEETKQEKRLEVKTLKALSEKRHSLHTNISYNGKTFDKMTLKQLKGLYNTITESVNQLKANTLNESAVEQSVLDTIDKKNKLLKYIDEEITYRITRQQCLKKLNEDGAEISDEELKNLFGPAQGEEETSNAENTEDSNNDENNNENEDEVAELSRIEITLKDVEAANDLKQACLDADIPEDAFELENVEEESATEDEENSEENSEEGSEDQGNVDNGENTEEENSSENANESYEYAQYVNLLLEGEVPEDDTEETTPEDQQTDDNGDSENTEENSDDNSEEEEDKQPKFILTNTDYAFKLAQVLNDVYGITKEEFEEMIGGEIVEEEPNTDDENSDENSDKKSDDKGDKENNDSEDEIDPSDLFKNL